MQRDLHALLNKMKSGADWVGLREVYESESYRMARDGKVQPNETMQHNGLMIEVIVEGQSAYSATNSFDESEIMKTFENAVNLARKSSGHKLFMYDQSVRPKATGKYRSQSKLLHDSQSAGEINQALIRYTEQLKSSDKVVSTLAMAILVNGSSRFVSSNGSDVEQEFDLLSSNLSVTAHDGREPQTRSTGQKVFQGGLEFFAAPIMETDIERLNREVHELLDAENCPTEKMKLLLAPDQLYLQIHESIGHPLELDRILGDERNYAGWSFVKPDDFGKLRYGSDLLNITFDPTLTSELASYMYDDTGVKAAKEYIIQQGILKRGLGSLESQRRLKIEGVANARATSWNRAPIDRMANINLEPGESTLEQMISQVERGIYMHTNRSWSIDDYRNKFQFGCEYAQLIEDGRLTKVVRNPNYRDVTTPFWNRLIAVGDADTFVVGGSYYCGKGEPNQLIRVGHATPTCLFDQVEVFGGGK